MASLIKTAVVLPALLVGGVANAKLSYSRSGHGPGVVLLHALGCTRAQWQRTVARLEKTHTVLAFDLPGHGKSPGPTATTTPATATATTATLPTVTIDLDAIAREIGSVIRKEKLAPAIVIGHSLGGTVAGHLAAVDPGATRAVVVVDSLIGPLPVPASERAQLREEVARDHDGAMRKFYGDMATPAQVDRVMATAHDVAGPTWMAYIDAFATQAVADGGRAIAAPVLLMTSQQLLPASAAQAKVVVDAGFGHVADLSVARFETRMHWLEWEEPAQFDAALDAFLARVETHAGR